MKSIKGTDFIAKARIGKWVWRVTTSPKKDADGRRYVWAIPLTMIQAKTGYRMNSESMTRSPAPSSRIFHLPLPKWSSKEAA